MKYQLKVKGSLIQASDNITDLQRIAANLNINSYEIVSHHSVVYSINGGF